MLSQLAHEQNKSLCETPFRELLAANHRRGNDFANKLLAIAQLAVAIELVQRHLDEWEKLAAV